MSKFKPENFYILHLSDLHIRNEGKSFYSDDLKKLLADIEEQTRQLSNIILVISGDIIDRGNYFKNFDTAKRFFSDMHAKMNNRIIDIIVVPGNHDKKRSHINSLISYARSEKGLSKNYDSFDIEWIEQKESLSDYMALYNFVLELFEIDREEIKDTFGVDKVKIHDKNIVFLKIDTAWCSYSDNDHRKLIVGEHQLRSLNTEYRDLRNHLEQENESVDLTIAVSHHPMNWLKPDEEEKCNKYFMLDNYLNVDLLMCGHVHDFSVFNHFNHEHSLLTLVTGVGWQSETPNDERDIHRYSIYSFNLNYNSCDIIMRRSKSNGDFDYDYSVYVGKKELKDNKLRYPLKVKNNTSFIRINTANTSDSNGLFISDEIVEMIPHVAEAISFFVKNTTQLLEHYKGNALDIAEEKLIDEPEVFDQLFRYLYEDENLTQELKDKCLNSEEYFPYYLAFLNEICSYTVTSFSECFSKDTILRAHFRWHDYEQSRYKTIKDVYCKLCKASNLDPKDDQPSMQDITWGSLIKIAFDAGTPVVFSANSLYNSVKTEWDDFITLIPKFTNYTHDIKIKRNQTESRPILTFGISIKNTAGYLDSLVLYILEYLRFDKILANVMDEYMDLFNIDAKQFITNTQALRGKDNA